MTTQARTGVRQRPSEALEPDLAHLDTITPYRDPDAPRPKRTKEEQERLDERAMALRAHGKTFRQIAAELDMTVSSAHGRVMRHLHRQRTEYHEHVADIRDYDLLKLQQLEPVVFRNAQEGDGRAAAQFMRLVELRHKLLKINNPTNIEELMRKEDFAIAVAKRFNDEAIEEAENSARTAREQTGEQTGEHGANIRPEAVAASSVAPATQVFSEPANERRSAGLPARRDRTGPAAHATAERAAQTWAVTPVTEHKRNPVGEVCTQGRHRRGGPTVRRTKAVDRAHVGVLQSTPCQPDEIPPSFTKIAGG